MSAAVRPSVGLVGLGAALPETARRPDDPVFDHLRTSAGEPDLSFFMGGERRCLAPGESLSALTARAARAALADAGIGASDVDRLYGHLSPSEFIAPNELFRVHRDLDLPVAMPVVPIQAEYNAFLLGIEHAWEAISGGRAWRALVVVGAGLSRQTDAAQAYARSIGDAAGAAVVGRSEQLVIVDAASDTWSTGYGDITIRPRPEEGIRHPLFRFEPGRFIEATSLVTDGPPRLMSRLLERHGLQGDDITLITHQNSRRILDHWKDRLRPRDYFDTLDELGNMQFASVPVTLTRYRHALSTKYLLLFAAGMAGNMTAVLVRV